MVSTTSGNRGAGIVSLHVSCLPATASGLGLPTRVVNRACTSKRNRPFLNRATHVITVGILAAMLTITALPGWAQVADSVLVLETIMVEGQQEDEVAFPGALSMRLGMLSALAAPDAARLLDHAPSVEVGRAGTSGAALASFRGLGSASTRIEFDGIRLVDPATGSFDLSLFPPSLIGSIAVVSGAADGSIPGGRIVLGAPRAAPFQASFQRGSFGYQEMGGRVGTTRPHASASMMVSRSSFDGAFPYRHPVWPGNPVVRRRGAARSHTAALLSFQHHARPIPDAGGQSAGGVLYRAVVLATHVDRLLPSLSISEAQAASQQDALVLGGLHMQTQWGDMPVQATVSTTHSRFRYEHPERDSSRVALGQVALRARLDKVLSRAWTVAVEPSLAMSRTTTVASYDVHDAALRLSAGYVRRGWMLGVFLDSRHRSTRTMGSSSGENVLAMTPGVWWSRVLIPGLQSRLAVARVLRLPTLNERYWTPGGNPELRSEQGLQAEWMLSYQPNPSLHVRLVSFLSRMQDRIVWRPALLDPSRPIWTPDNVALVQGHGMEFYLSWSPLPSMTAMFSGTRRIQLDRSNPAAASHGHQLRFVAPWSARGTLEWSRGTLGFFATWYYSARRFTATDESTWMPSHRTLDGGLAWRPILKRVPFTVRLSGMNLLGAAYESSPWMPMPGRSWRFGVAVGG